MDAHKDLLLDVLSHYGLEEIVGEKHNPEILAFFAEIGFDWVHDDETAWCSASLNYFCKKLGYERSGRLDARSWLKMPVLVLKPELGDVVVLWRESPTSWKGHVGLFISKNATHVYILGGNQGNMIKITPYPIDRVLGYRRLKKLTDIH